MVERYRKRPLEVEAIHCTFSNRDDWWKDLEDTCEKYGINPIFGTVSGEDQIVLPCGCHELFLYDGDYLVKGIDGSIYPVKRETFEKTYDKVVDTSDIGFIAW